MRVNSRNGHPSRIVGSNLKNLFLWHSFHIFVNMNVIFLYDCFIAASKQVVMATGQTLAQRFYYRRSFKEFDAHYGTSSPPNYFSVLHTKKRKKDNFLARFRRVFAHSPARLYVQWQ